MISSSIILRFCDLVLGIIELILGLRVIFKLLGASISAPFVNWVYETSRPLVAPFIGMFPSPILQGGFVIEFSTLFAVIFYSLVGYFISEAVGFVGYHSRVRRD